MHQALYRKYRSKSLEDVFGQDHITKTLERAVKSGKVSHAYLLTGPHGVGKTSVARILAHKITGLEYTDESHLDIIEIDAASNRRIDEIRDLREKVRIMPVEADKKVYIIDEVHMLTTEAFNALLKTLEEPPEHVVFILATTEAHKLPDTITSRTQRFQFLPIENRVLEKRLQFIAASEKINIKPDALALIARHAEGSFRDAISLIDQVAMVGDDEITKADAERLLGVTSEQHINSLHDAVIAGDTTKVYSLITELYQNGYSAVTVAAQLGSKIRMNFATAASENALQLASDLLDVKENSQPERKLELVLLSASLSSAPQPSQTPLQSTATQSPAPQTVQTPPKATTLESSKTNTAQAADRPSPPPVTKQAVQAKPVENKDWDSMLERFKESNNALHAILRMAQPRITDEKIELAFKFPFHQKRAEQAKNRELVYSAIKSTFGNDILYESVVDGSITIASSALEAEEKKVDSPSSEASSVVDIMGGGEVIAYEE